VSDTPKHVGELWYRRAVNKSVHLAGATKCQNCTHPPCGGSLTSRTIVLVLLKIKNGHRGFAVQTSNRCPQLRHACYRDR